MASAVSSRGPLALAIDFGTSGTRAMLVDKKGKLVAQATRPSSVIKPKRVILNK